MTRRAPPSIDPGALRDHATGDRVARIWERIERDLPDRPVPGAAPRRPGLARTAALLAAASLGAFAAGLFVGRAAAPSRPPAAAALPVATDVAPNDVFAAGTRGRSFPLPGGGELSLSPGATVEIERGDDGSVTLRLVQGGAAVHTGSERGGRPVAIVAGDAILSADAGSVVRVTRTTDTLDVAVTVGGAHAVSPAGSQRLEQGETRALPLRSVTAVAEPIAAPSAAKPQRVAPVVAMAPPAAAASDQPVAAAPPPDWRALYASYKWREAYQALELQSGGVAGAIAAAGSARELAEIADIARTGGDHEAAARAYERVLERFGTDANHAPLAAKNLARHHEKKGEIDKARAYFERARSMPGPGQAVMADSAACLEMRQAAKGGGDKEGAARLAREYVKQYPNGSCREVADRILGGHEPYADDEAAALEPAESAPPDEPAKPGAADAPDAKAPSP